MAIAFVQAGHGAGTTTATITKTFGAGDLVCVATRTDDANHVATPTDGVNTYVMIGLVAGVKIDVNQNWGNLAVFYAKNVAAGSTTITATGTAGDNVEAMMLEYSGVDTTAPLDQAAQNRTTTTSTQAVTGVTGTRTSANEVLVCFGCTPAQSSTFAAGPNFTIRDTTASNQLAGEDWIVSSTGTDQGIWADFGAQKHWGCHVATFIAAAGGGGGSTIGDVNYRGSNRGSGGGSNRGTH